MILIYTQTGELEGEALELAKSITGKVGYRAVRHWKGEKESVTLVYSDNEKVRAAYLRAGIKAEPITKKAPKPAAKAVPKAAPKKPTTRTARKTK